MNRVMRGKTRRPCARHNCSNEIHKFLAGTRAANADQGLTLALSSTSSSTSRLFQLSTTYYSPSYHTVELSMYAKLILSLVAITVAALFSAQSAEAVRGPKITHKVYFDIKHGDKDLGRSALVSVHKLRSSL